jgi:hypothetical protein
MVWFSISSTVHGPSLFERVSPETSRFHPHMRRHGVWFKISSVVHGTSLFERVSSVEEVGAATHTAVRREKSRAEVRIVMECTYMSACVCVCVFAFLLTVLNGKTLFQGMQDAWTLVIGPKLL